MAASTIVLDPPSPIKPIWVRTTKADTLRRRRDGPSLTRLSTCSSFLATRVLDRRNRPNENRFRFPNRLPYKRSCSVSAAERCGRKNSADASCRKSQSQLDSVSFVHGSFPCVADRHGLQHRARRIQIPRISLDRCHLDSRELEETSIGNYSGHAPTASRLRTELTDRTGLTKPKHRHEYFPSLPEPKGFSHALPASRRRETQRHECIDEYGFQSRGVSRGSWRVEA